MPMHSTLVLAELWRIREHMCHRTHHCSHTQTRDIQQCNHFAAQLDSGSMMVMILGDGGDYEQHKHPRVWDDGPRPAPTLKTWW